MSQQETPIIYDAVFQPLGFNILMNSLKHIWISTVSRNYTISLIDYVCENIEFLKVRKKQHCRVVSYTRMRFIVKYGKSSLVINE